MNNADWIFLNTTNRILKEGIWDTNQVVRPKWPDGVPAHSAKVFAINNVYNLGDGFPISTLRFTNWRAAIDEVLWIWQKKSNKISDLHSHIWDAWADENGTIGKAYGWQVAQVAAYPFGNADQIDMVLHYLHTQPAFRGMVTELFKHEDLHEMGLSPCVHGMQFDVGDGKLNLFLNQRSNDTLAAGNWNVVQYAALVHMLAQEAGLRPGTLSHMIVNSHIYDRHMPYIAHMTMARAKLVEERLRHDDVDYSAVDAMEKLKAQTFAKVILSSDMRPHYDREIDKAQQLQLDADKHDAKFFEDYAKSFVKTNGFVKADYIVTKILENPNFNKIFSPQVPQLVLDSNVKDFYKFVSPLTFDENGKIVQNPNSSFDVQNYDYQSEGIKFSTRVPVAE